VVTASDTAVDDAVTAVVLAAAGVAGVPDVAAVEVAEDDEFEHAAPARPSTAIPPIRRKVRRSARAARCSGVNDLVMVQSNTGCFPFTHDLVENNLRIRGATYDQSRSHPSNPPTQPAANER